MPTAVKNGFTFEGCYLDAELTTPFLLPDSTEYAEQVIDRAITLYPKFMKIPVFAVIHFAGTNLPDMTVEITNGAVMVNFTDLLTITKTGFTFGGWHLDEALSIPFLLPGNTEYAGQAVDRDITLYPLWEPISVPEPPKEQEPPPKPEREPLVINVPVEPETETESPTSPESEITTPPNTEKTEIPKQKTVPQVEQPPQRPENTVPDVSVSHSQSKEDVVPMYQYVILAIFAAVAAGIGCSSVSDLQVLKWYERKKATYLSKAEVMR